MSSGATRRGAVRLRAGAQGKCAHAAEVGEVTPQTDGCEECLKVGDRWAHLRVCMVCGKVGCCDSSKNKHATKHFHESDHAVMRSVERGEDWGWCYVDEVIL
jgi:CPA2 family monovalent cation:H+ antiporter-2